MYVLNTAGRQKYCLIWNSSLTGHPVCLLNAVILLVPPLYLCSCPGLAAPSHLYHQWLTHPLHPAESPSWLADSWLWGVGESVARHHWPGVHSPSPVAISLPSSHGWKFDHSHPSLPKRPSLTTPSKRTLLHPASPFSPSSPLSPLPSPERDNKHYCYINYFI